MAKETGIGSGFGSFGDVNIGVNFLPEQAIKQSNKLSANLRNMSAGGVASFKALQIQSQNSMKGITGSLLGFRNLLLFGGIVFGFKSIITATAEFQSKLMEISIISGNSALVFGKLQDKLLSMSSTLGIPLNEVASGMRDIVSAQVPMAEGMDILEASSKLSIGSLTKMSDATSALITLMQGYPGAFKDATDASDLLFAIQDRGRIEMKDLALTIGRIIPIAKSSGLTIEELGQSIAEISRGIPNADEAITALRSTINALAKPSQSSITLARQYGIELGTTAVSAGNFHKTLEKIWELAPDLRRRILEDTRAVNGASAMMTQYSQSGGADYIAITQRAGKTGKAFEAQQMSLSNMMVRFTSTVRELTNSIGTALIPILTILLNRFIALADILKGDRLSNFVTNLSTAFLSLYDNTKRIADSLIKLGTVLFSVGKDTGDVIDPFKILNGTVDLITSAIDKLTSAIQILKREFGDLAPLATIVGGLLGAKFGGGILGASAVAPGAEHIGILRKGGKGIGTKLRFTEGAEGTGLLGLLSGGLTGRAIGAGIGSILPGPGTLIGAGLGLIISQLVTELGGLETTFKKISGVFPDLTTKLSNFGDGLRGFIEMVTGLTLTQEAGTSNLRKRKLESELRDLNISIKATESKTVTDEVKNWLVRHLGVPVLRTRFKFGDNVSAIKARRSQIEEELKSLEMPAREERRVSTIQPAIEEVDKLLGKSGKRIGEFPGNAQFIIFQRLADVVERGSIESKAEAKKIFDQISRGEKFNVETFSASVEDLHKKVIEEIEKAKFTEAFALVTPENLKEIEKLILELEKLGIKLVEIDKAQINNNLSAKEATTILTQLKESQASYNNQIATLRTRFEEVFPGYNKFYTQLTSLGELIKDQKKLAEAGFEIPTKLLENLFKGIITGIGSVSKTFDDLTPDMKKKIQELANALGITDAEIRQRMRRGWQELSEFMTQAQRATQSEISNFLYNTLTGQITGAKELFKSLWKSIILKPFTEMLAGNIAQALWNPNLTGAGRLGFFPKLLKGFNFFAEGGIVRKPTLGLVGEKGPEAVIPLKQLSEQRKEKPQTILDRPIIIANLLDSETLFRAGDKEANDVIVNRIAQNITQRGVVFRALRGVA